MTQLVYHVYDYAEAYTVLLSMVTVPLGYWAALLFYRNHCEAATLNLLPDGFNFYLRKKQEDGGD